MPEQKTTRECQSPLQEELKAYLDSELAPVRHAAVAKHLTTCPACQSELVALRQLSAQLTETLPATEPLPDALRARILAALPEKSAPQPFSLAFWFRPGPMAALSGTVAMGCALLLWLRVPESSKSAAPSKTLEHTEAPSEAPVAPAMVADRATQAKEEKQKPEPTSAATPTPAPLPATQLPVALPPVSALMPLPSQQYAGELKSDNAKSINQPLSAPKPSGSSQRTLSPAKPRTNVLTIPEPESAKPEANASKANASKKMAADSSLPNPVIDTPSGSSVSRRTVVPTSYTLTIAAGKRTETLESIQKLADELAVTMGNEQPELSLQLAPERREALLERLKALGVLTETQVSLEATLANPAYSPSIQQRSALPRGQARDNQMGGRQSGGGGFGGSAASVDGFSGGRGSGAFGGGRAADTDRGGLQRDGSTGQGGPPGKPVATTRAQSQSSPPLRLTLVIKEADPQKQSERKELP